MSFQKVKVGVMKLPHFRGELPRYQTEGASGMDVRARVDGPVRVPVGQRTLIPTGLSFEIPPGWEIQVRPRSGWALNKGVCVLNSPGTIDSDYRGELKIILANLGESELVIEDQERIAQLVLCPVSHIEFIERQVTGATARGSGGFGSTGF